MGFSPMKFKPESGANRIKSADDAYSFMVHMRLSYQNKPHWQVARQAINQACMSEASEIRAWRPFGRRQRRKAGLKSLTNDFMRKGKSSYSLGLSRVAKTSREVSFPLRLQP